jgi:hypothetical protein
MSGANAAALGTSLVHTLASAGSAKTASESTTTNPAHANRAANPCIRTPQSLGLAIIEVCRSDCQSAEISACVAGYVLPTRSHELTRVVPSPGNRKPEARFVSEVGSFLAARAMTSRLGVEAWPGSTSGTRVPKSDA